MSATLELTKALISCPSVTPDDAGCQTLIAERLKKSGFKIEPMPFGEVANLWARCGEQGPLFVFAGHTDVVPPGPLDAWRYNPFTPTVQDGILYGRGAADMKSGLAAMIVAAENFIQENPDFPGSIAFLITSDEEGPSINGTQKVIEKLSARGEKIDYCIVGEASSTKTLGDQIRIGRRGSLHGKLKIAGKQGHVAFPELAHNPIHASCLALNQLANEVWDYGNEAFPPTTFQISNLHSGTGATNVIPGQLEALFNFRFSTALDVQEIKSRAGNILDSHKLTYELEWELSGSPFLTKQGKLIQAAHDAIDSVMKLKPILSTGGGTSDGRFIAPTGAEVIELGPCNATIHQINEHIHVSELEPLTKIYQLILRKLFF